MSNSTFLGRSCHVVAGCRIFSMFLLERSNVLSSKPIHTRRRDRPHLLFFCSRYQLLLHHDPLFYNQPRLLSTDLQDLDMNQSSSSTIRFPLDSENVKPSSLSSTPPPPACLEAEPTVRTADGNTQFLQILPPLPPQPTLQETYCGVTPQCSSQFRTSSQFSARGFRCAIPVI